MYYLFQFVKYHLWRITEEHLTKITRKDKNLFLEPDKLELRIFLLLGKDEGKNMMTFNFDNEYSLNKNFEINSFFNRNNCVRYYDFTAENLILKYIKTNSSTSSYLSIYLSIYLVLFPMYITILFSTLNLHLTLSWYI